jgi:hypothetical protein
VVAKSWWCHRGQLRIEVTTAGRCGMFGGMNAQPTSEDAPHLVGADEFAQSRGWSAGSPTSSDSAA